MEQIRVSRDEWRQMRVALYAAIVSNSAIMSVGAFTWDYVDDYLKCGGYVVADEQADDKLRDELARFRAIAQRIVMWWDTEGGDCVFMEIVDAARAALAGKEVGHE